MKKICSLHFKKGKTKIQPKALASLTKILNIVVLECALRSGKQAYAEDSKTVTLDIVQKVIPQLVSSNMTIIYFIV